METIHKVCKYKHAKADVNKGSCTNYLRQTVFFSLLLLLNRGCRSSSPFVHESLYIICQCTQHESSVLSLSRIEICTRKIISCAPYKANLQIIKLLYIVYQKIQFSFLRNFFRQKHSMFRFNFPISHLIFRFHFQLFNNKFIYFIN